MVYDFYIKNSLLFQKQRYFPLLPSKSHIVLPTTFRHLIPRTDIYIWFRHPIFIYVGRKFPLLNINQLFSQNNLLQSLFPYHWLTVSPLSYAQCRWPSSAFSIIFYGLIYQSLHQYHALKLHSKLYLPEVFFF